MASGITFDATATLAEIRKRLGNGAERIVNKGLREAGKPIAAAQKNIVARSNRRGVHIQDDIRVSGVRSDKLYGKRFVLIGGTGKTKWRHHFLEFGTSKMTAQPFIEPGFHEGKDEAVKILAEEFEKGLRE